MLFVTSIILIFFYWINISLGVLLSFFLFLIVLTNGLFNKNIIINGKDKFFLIYGFFAFLPVISGKETINLFVKIVVYPWLLSFIFQNIDLNLKKIKIIIFSLLIVTGVISFIMFFQAAPKQFEFSLDYILTKDRTYGFYFLDDKVRLGPTTIATMLSFEVVGLLALLKFNEVPKILGWSVWVVFMVLLIIAGGRSSLIAAFLAIILYYVKSDKRSIKKVFIQFLGLFLVIFFLFNFFSVIISFQNKNFYNRLLFFENYQQDSSLLTRLILWGNAINLIYNNFFGLGFHYFFDKFGLTTHNEYLAQLVGTGQAGGLIYILMLIYIGIKVFQRLIIIKINKNSSALKHYFVASAFLVGLIAMFTENISVSSQNIFYPLFWISVGLFFNKRGDNENGFN